MKKKGKNSFVNILALAVFIVIGYFGYKKLRTFFVQVPDSVSVPEVASALSVSTGSGMNNVLKRGDSGNAVRLLQERLNKFGFNLKIDGVFGEGTENAVRTFQERLSLAVDGVVGSQTWKFLNADLPSWVTVF